MVAHASAAPHIRKALKIADFQIRWGPHRRPTPAEADRDIKTAMRLLRAVQNANRPGTAQ